MKKFIWRSEKILDRDKPTYRSWKTQYSKEGGWVDDSATFEFDYKDHFLIINDDRNWVILSPEQVSYLANLLLVEEIKFVNECVVTPKDDSDI